ncbi:prenyltransferase/squalene oxidase repeat-containing protein [Embleya sp. NBC_00896]|uniref:prenyltransferase/squalene oxidase repeat-containing protein n=1 Tax=Embleya sp. NBC_00896 TaxID=2975961 RepID=UPI00386E3024|nr:terpene cyclase/mutase family protein [Embleya sp. NBC_00896]
MLESALLLRLLERAGIESDHHRRVAVFLSGRLDSAEPLDRLLATIALRPWDDALEHGAGDLLDRFLERAPAFLNVRKRVMLETVLTLLGPPRRAYRAFDPDAFDTGNLHPWAHVQTVALKVALADLTGHADAVTPAELRLLVDTQQAPGVWEGNLLVHLLVLHALADRPHLDGLIVRGVAKALAHQRADGGLPFVTDTDTWCAVTAGVALDAAGAPFEVRRRIADHLAARQRVDGGWSYTDAAALADVDDTSVAIEFLHATDPIRYRRSIDFGLRALWGYQGPDGGFPTYIAGAPSEACMTAAAVNALSVRTTRHVERITAARRFLAGAQHPDGTFEPDWSRSRYHAIFRALLATDAWGPDAYRATVKRALAAVREGQNADGGWGQQPGDPSDAISTAYALIALCRQSDPRPLVRGVEHLLRAQRPDGGIESVPDMLGTRPFLYVIPCLADHFTLLALGHLANRLTGRSHDPGAPRGPGVRQAQPSALRTSTPGPRTPGTGRTAPTQTGERSPA